MKFSHQPKARLTNEAGLSWLACSLHAFSSLCAHHSTLPKYSFFVWVWFFSSFSDPVLAFQPIQLHLTPSLGTARLHVLGGGGYRVLITHTTSAAPVPRQPRSPFSPTASLPTSSPAGRPRHEGLREAGPPALPASPDPVALALVPCGQRGGWERAGRTHLPAGTWQRASPSRWPGPGRRRRDRHRAEPRP